MTIKEIAKIAGVSTATVSHVINSSRFVSAELTNRVHEAMRATGYKPNIAAYALRTQKTKTIGLLLPILMDETSNVYFMQMMLGIEAVFEAEGYCVILGNTQENVQVEKRMLEHFQNIPDLRVLIDKQRRGHDFRNGTIRHLAVAIEILLT